MDTESRIKWPGTRGIGNGKVLSQEYGVSVLKNANGSENKWFHNVLNNTNYVSLNGYYCFYVYLWCVCVCMCVKKSKRDIHQPCEYNMLCTRSLSAHSGSKWVNPKTWDPLQNFPGPHNNPDVAIKSERPKCPNFYYKTEGNKWEFVYKKHTKQSPRWAFFFLSLFIAFRYLLTKIIVK